MWWALLQYFVGEVIKDVAVAAGEVGDECADVIFAFESLNGKGSHL